jgi:valyl-tRNA synthetase
VNLPPNIRPEAFLLSDNPILERERELIATLSKTASVTVVKSEADIPKGCGTANVSTTKIFVSLKQYLDLDKEIQKLEKKLLEVQGFIDRVIKKTQVKDYKEKASEKAQRENQENLDKYQAEFQVVKDSIQKLQDLKK